MSERPLPHDQELEAAALGAALIDERAADVVFESLAGRDFHVPAMRQLFEVASSLHETGQAIEPAVLRHELEVQGLLARVGGREVVGCLIEACTSAGMVETYVSRLRDLTRRRELWTCCTRASRAVQDPSTWDEDVAPAEWLRDELDRILSDRSPDLPQDLHELAEPIAKEALQGPVRECVGLPTGVAGGSLDRLTGGIQRSQYWVLAARTSVGKSTLVNAIALGLRAICPDAGMPLLVSTEMSTSGIARGALAARAGVHTQGIAKADLTLEQRGAVARVIERQELAGVAVVALKNRTLPALAALAKRHKSRYGLPLLVIDLASKLVAAGRDLFEQMTSVSAALAALKLELDTCILATVQINRASFGTTDRRPELHHLKQTGAWEEDADRVLLLHRPSYHGQEDTRTEIIQAKDRDFGQIGSTFLQWHQATGEYSDANSAGGAECSKPGRVGVSLAWRSGCH